MKATKNMNGYALTAGMLCFMLVMATDGAAFAEAVSGGAALGAGVCESIKFMTGPVGKAIATAGIIVIAVGALLGRVSWGMAVMIAAGIAGIFGAPAIAEAIGKGANKDAAGGYCG